MNSKNVQMIFLKIEFYPEGTMELARKWQAISLVSMAVNDHNHLVQSSTITWSKVTSAEDLIYLGYDNYLATGFMNGCGTVLLRIGSWDCAMQFFFGVQFYEYLYYQASKGISVSFKARMMIKMSYSYICATHVIYENNILLFMCTDEKSPPMFVMHISEFRKFIDMAKSFNVRT
jgi:hypothetical protein